MVVRRRDWVSCVHWVSKQSSVEHRRCHNGARDVDTAHASLRVSVEWTECTPCNCTSRIGNVARASLNHASLSSPPARYLLGIIMDVAVLKNLINNRNNLFFNCSVNFRLIWCAIATSQIRNLTCKVIKQLRYSWQNTVNKSVTSLLHVCLNELLCQCRCQCQSRIYIAHSRRASNVLIC